MCKRLKKPSLWPVVVFSFTDDFNEAVSSEVWIERTNWKGWQAIFGSTMRCLTSASVSGEPSIVKSAVTKPAPATSTHMPDKESEDETSVVKWSVRRNVRLHPDNCPDIVDAQNEFSEITQD